MVWMATPARLAGATAAAAAIQPFSFALAALLET